MVLDFAVAFCCNRPAPALPWVACALAFGFSAVICRLWPAHLPLFFSAVTCRLWPVTYNVLMPIFEYVCRECDHHFESIVLSSQKPACPKCQSKKLEQQISRFAVSGGDKTSSFATDAGGPCGTCGDPRGPGSCSFDS
jgi:putative FmdB family regulatory protein